jgi:L,D-peptidoglycan transpeptidase YkuD (ErfK/YbiS/YcfS/YnhG family)
MDGAGSVRLVKLLFILVGLSGCATLLPSKQPPQTLQSLPVETQQAIIVEPLNSSRARLTAWEFRDNRWQPAFLPMRAMVGRKGIAPLNEKREGDGRTPSGNYPIGTAFGYAPSFATRLPYRQSTGQDFWVDDVNSPQYNRWVTGKPDAKSFEEMRRKDDLYKYGAVIEYNTNPVVPGMGSAIFIHIWRGPEKSTSGCVALSPRSLKNLLGWLDSRRNPVIILEWNM